MESLSVFVVFGLYNDFTKHRSWILQKSDKIEKYGKE